MVDSRQLITCHMTLINEHTNNENANNERANAQQPTPATLCYRHREALMGSSIPPAHGLTTGLCCLRYTQLRAWTGDTWSIPAMLSQNLR